MMEKVQDYDELLDPEISARKAQLIQKQIDYTK